MATLTESEIISEFQDFDIEVKCGSTLLERLREIGGNYALDAEGLCNEWVAFSKQHNDCIMDAESMERWENQLHTNSRKIPSSKQIVSKTGSKPPVMHMANDLTDLFGESAEVENLMDEYATPQDKEKLETKMLLLEMMEYQKGQKRIATQTTPTTPPSKSRHTQNGAMPVALAAVRAQTTPLRSQHEDGLLSSTPAVKYSHRQNTGNTVCTLNESSIPQAWVGNSRTDMTIGYYDNETALKEPYEYMFQKVSEKALALIERIEEFGTTICQHHSLPEPLSVAQPSLEPAVFSGQVVCEGEGHLNVRSCLLEGTVRSRHRKGCVVKLDIPDTMTCSLFPGQVIAVEGINNYNGVLTPSTIYDEGVVPPLPRRTTRTVTGFTMIAATGPFTTSDSLEMDPLKDLLRVVAREKPNVLLLLGPYVDATHELVKNCNLPRDVTFDEFFRDEVLDPIHQCIRSCRTHTHLVMVPSQKDVHHPWAVYPQPPFRISNMKESPLVHFVSDPATLMMNGLCVGLTSTDVLFHLSARTMFRGPAGDRMARLAGHILRQQCYYPLLPPFRKEDQHSAKRGEEGEEGDEVQEEPTEVNLDVVHAFESQHAVLPARPDILFLPSDLKPFAKQVDGCICVNPGRLTKKAGGGTFAKISVPDQPAGFKPDFSSDIGVQIVCI